MARAEPPAPARTFTFVVDDVLVHIDYGHPGAVVLVLRPRGRQVPADEPPLGQIALRPPAVEGFLQFEPFRLGHLLGRRVAAAGPAPHRPGVDLVPGAELPGLRSEQLLQRRFGVGGPRGPDDAVIGVLPNLSHHPPGFPAVPPSQLAPALLQLADEVLVQPQVHGNGHRPPYRSRILAIGIEETLLPGELDVRTRPVAEIGLSLPPAQDRIEQLLQPLGRERAVLRQGRAVQVFGGGRHADPFALPDGVPGGQLLEPAERGQHRRHLRARPSLDLPPVRGNQDLGPVGEVYLVQWPVAALVDVSFQGFQGGGVQIPRGRVLGRVEVDPLPESAPPSVHVGFVGVEQANFPVAVRYGSHIEAAGVGFQGPQDHCQVAAPHLLHAIEKIGVDPVEGTPLPDLRPLRVARLQGGAHPGGRHVVLGIRSQEDAVGAPRPAGRRRRTRGRRRRTRGRRRRRRIPRVDPHPVLVPERVPAHERALAAPLRTGRLLPFAQPGRHIGVRLAHAPPCFVPAVRVQREPDLPPALPGAGAVVRVRIAVPLQIQAVVRVENQTPTRRTAPAPRRGPGRHDLPAPRQVLHLRQIIRRIPIRVQGEAPRAFRPDLGREGICRSLQHCRRRIPRASSQTPQPPQRRRHRIAQPLVQRPQPRQRIAEHRALSRRRGRREALHPPGLPHDLVDLAPRQLVVGGLLRVALGVEARHAALNLPLQERNLPSQRRLRIVALPDVLDRLVEESQRVRLILVDHARVVGRPQTHIVEIVVHRPLNIESVLGLRARLLKRLDRFLPPEVPGQRGRCAHVLRLRHGRVHDLPQPAVEQIERPDQLLRPIGVPGRHRVPERLHQTAPHLYHDRPRRGPRGLGESIDERLERVLLRVLQNHEGVPVRLPPIRHGLQIQPNQGRLVELGASL